jgi:hypothetical protein
MMAALTQGSGVLAMLYVLTSTLRVLFYWPQIRLLRQSPAAAESSSLVTWAYFALSHWVACGYFGVVLYDPFAVSISILNASASSAIAFLIASKKKLPECVSKSWEAVVQHPKKRSV